MKFCVTSKNTIVKLVWSADEELTGSAGIGNNPLNTDATAKYRLCRNDKQIGSTITSRNSFTLDTGNITSFETSFIQNRQPNFVYVDTPPVGWQCYQVKARILPPPVGNNITSTGDVTDRSLVAVSFDKN